MTRFRLVTIAAGALAALALATPTRVDAQTLDTFGVLGGSTVTNTGTSVISGNVGVSPGSAITGLGTTPSPGIVIGTLHSNDAVAINAQTELVTRIGALNALGVTQNLTGQDLGGLTLTPGVYRFDSSAQLTGPLTLDAQGDPGAVFVFQIGSTLTTASASSVLLIGGAQGSNVSWVVGSSATLGTTTAFAGRILAVASITLTTGATIECGAAWAQTAAVTLDTNAISAICAFSAFGGVLGPNATANARAIAAALDAFVTGGGTLPTAFQDLLDLLGPLTPEEQAAVFAQLSGEAGTGAAPAGAQAMDSFLSLLNPFLDNDETRGLDSDTIRALGYTTDESATTGATAAVVSFDHKSVRVAGPRGWNTWAGVYGGYNVTAGDASAGTHERTSSNFGLAGGFDTHVTPETKFGLAFSGGGTTFGLSDGLGGGKSDVLQAAIYARKNFDAAYVATSLAYAWNGVTTDRFVNIPDLAVSEHLLASFSAHNFAGEIEVGHRYEWITPYAAIRGQAFFTPAYGETAATGSTADYALNYEAHTTVSLRSELGARFNRSLALHDGATLALQARIAWAHEFASGASTVAQFQGLPGAPFTTQGAAAGHDSLLLTAGAEVRFTNGFAVAGTFDTAFALGSQTYTGTGRVSYMW